VKVGDLVQLAPQSWHTGYDMLVGIVVECVGTRCEVLYTDGRCGNPMRDALEVLNESR